MKRRARQAVLVASGVLMLAGCMSVGRRFPTEDVPRIKVNESTRADVRKMFGSPWRSGMENGETTWTYGHYRYSLFSDASTVDLVVRFDEDGVVSSYSFNTTEGE